MDIQAAFVTPALLTIVIALGAWAIARIQRIDTKNHELHKWHAPDSNGEQLWKNPRIDQLCEKVDTLTEEMRELVFLIKIQQAKQQD
jgi:hypothetical protein